MALNDTEFAMITSTSLNTSLRIYIRPTLPEEFNDFSWSWWIELFKTASSVTLDGMKRDEDVSSIISSGHYHEELNFMMFICHHQRYISTMTNLSRFLWNQFELTIDLFLHETLSFSQKRFHSIHVYQSQRVIILGEIFLLIEKTTGITFIISTKILMTLTINNLWT